jgi:hypothetical protein
MMQFSVDTTQIQRSGCRSLAGKGFGTVFFGLFFLMGALFTVFILGEALKQLAPWWWPATDCTILSSGVGDTSDDQNPYRAVVRYRYEIDGRAYESDRMSRSDGGTPSFDRARDRAARYQPGAAGTCRVSPNHPALAVLERRIPWIVFAVLFPLIFVAIGGIGLYATWRGSPSGKEPAIESISQKATSGRGHKALVFMGLIFAVVGGAVFVPMTGLPAIRLAASMTWEATPCTIVKSKMRSWSTDDGTSYRADVLYEYRAGGRTWRSNQVDFFSILTSGRGNSRAVLDRYPGGADTSCWVDPGDPSRSVLERQIRPKHLLGLIPLIFVIAGATLANYGWKRLGLRRSVEETAAGEDVPADGPLILKPQVGPVGKVAASVFFSLFWNGIISVFVWQAWKAWESGSPDWFLNIFLIPFVLVGLFSFGVVGHFLLALANPRPRMTLIPGSPRLGDELHLDWRFTGRAGRLGHVRIFLEGREEATYQRGTDTVTDREVFATHNLVDTGNDREIPTGAAEIVIPSDTMHSFAADSNKIIWEIKVEGEIAHWPDVSQDFPIEIRPTRIGDV